FLLVLGALVLIRHRRQPLGWVEALAGVLRRLGRFFRQSGFEFGVDLRGTPPLRSGYPPIVLGVILVLAAWATVVVTFLDAFPQDVRQLLAHVWYLGYLLLLIGFWATLICCTVIAMIVPAAMIHDRFVTHYTGEGRRSRRWEYLCMAAYFG